MIGTLVKYVGPSDGGHVYHEFLGAHGLVIRYTEKGQTDGKPHARIRWITPVKYAGRRTPFSDFGFNSLQIINEANEDETTI